jgi:hypothetical protein
LIQGSGSQSSWANKRSKFNVLWIIHHEHLTIRQAPNNTRMKSFSQYYPDNISAPVSARAARYGSLFGTGLLHPDAERPSVKGLGDRKPEGNCAFSLPSGFLAPRPCEPVNITVPRYEANRSRVNCCAPTGCANCAQPAAAAPPA